MKENTLTKVIPNAIYTGFSNHDCATYYRCPICRKTFSSWEIPNVTYKCRIQKCPFCDSDLIF